MMPREKITQAETNDNSSESRPAQHGTADKVFHKLAKAFNGLHWVMGVTTLPATATSRDERSFVLMWLGIIVFMLVFFAVLIYLLGSI
jgi:hypothetical protein